MSGAWRTYDVRGATEDVREIADALRPHLKGHDVIIGSDGSPDARGITYCLDSRDRNHWWTTTPALFWASRWHDLAIMVTASHDGRDGVTGIKICEQRRPWSDHEYDRLRVLLSGEAVDVGNLIPEAAGYRSVDPEHELTAYARSFEAVGELAGLHVGIHAGSGVAADCAAFALVSIGAQPEIDIVVGLDPAQEPQDVEITARYEVFLDADADRCSIRIDGVWWSPAQMLPLLAILGRNRHMGTVALIDLRTPRETIEALRTLRLEPRFADSGRAMNAAVAGTEVAVIGAETSSGHFYWPERGGLDDGIWTAAVALEMLVRSDKHLPFDEREPVEERRDVFFEAAAPDGADPIAVADDGCRWEWPSGSWIAARARTSDGQHTVHWQGAEGQAFAEEAGIA